MKNRCSLLVLAVSLSTAPLLSVGKLPRVSVPKGCAPSGTSVVSSFRIPTWKIALGGLIVATGVRRIVSAVRSYQPSERKKRLQLYALELDQNSPEMERIITVLNEYHYDLSSLPDRVKFYKASDLFFLVNYILPSFGATTVRLGNDEYGVCIHESVFDSDSSCSDKALALIVLRELGKIDKNLVLNKRRLVADIIPNLSVLGWTGLWLAHKHGATPLRNGGLYLTMNNLPNLLANQYLSAQERAADDFVFVRLGSDAPEAARDFVSFAQGSANPLIKIAAQESRLMRFFSPALPYPYGCDRVKRAELITRRVTEQKPR